MNEADEKRIRRLFVSVPDVQTLLAEIDRLRAGLRKVREIVFQSEMPRDTEVWIERTINELGVGPES